MSVERGDIALCPFREEDDEEVLRLLTTAFDRWPKAEISVAPIEHLRWKLNSDPLALQTHKVVKSDAKIVGFALTLVQRIKIGERIFLASKGADNAVHPAYQGRGVMTKLRQSASTQPRGTFEMYFGLRSGHTAIHKLRRFNRGDGFHTEVDILAASPKAAAPAHTGACSIRRIDRFDDRFDAFWRGAAAPFQAIPVRDSDYLNWRYCDPRAGAFEASVAEEDRRILGYVVSRVSFGDGYIADLLVLPDRFDVVAALIANAFQYLRGAGAPDVECLCPPDHPYRPLLRDMGFTKLRRTAQITYQTYTAGSETLEPLRRPGAVVHFMLGDTDLI